MTDNLPPSLDRFGHELEAAIRRDLERGPVQAHAGGRRRRIGPLAVGIFVAVVVALVLVLPGRQVEPAYALVRHVDGAVTVIVRSLDGTIAPLNGRFRALGIDETVLPVATGCRTTAIFVTVPPGESADRLTFRTDRRLLLAGWHGIIAARALRSGRVALVLGAIRGGVPRCVALAPTGRVLGFRHAGASAASQASGPHTPATGGEVVEQSRLLAVALAGSQPLPRATTRFPR